MDLSTLAAANVPEDQITQTLDGLLHDPEFLPEGGLLGFGLRYQYPIKSSISSVKEQHIEKALKGSDSAIFRLLLEKGLMPFLTAVYKDDSDGVSIMTDVLVEWESTGDEAASWYLCEESGKVIEIHDPELNYGGHEVDEPVTWVTKPIHTLNSYTHVFACYGNEPMTDEVYADITLMVRIGKYGSRGEV